MSLSTVVVSLPKLVLKDKLSCCSSYFKCKHALFSKSYSFLKKSEKFADVMPFSCGGVPYDKWISCFGRHADNILVFVFRA